jgi:hypothetical protein
MIGSRSAETIRVERDRIDDCRQPLRPLQLPLAQAGLSIDVSDLLRRALMLRAKMGIRVISATTTLPLLGAFGNLLAGTNFERSDRRME